MKHLNSWKFILKFQLLKFILMILFCFVFEPIC